MRWLSGSSVVVVLLSVLLLWAFASVNVQNAWWLRGWLLLSGGLLLPSVVLLGLLLWAKHKRCHTLEAEIATKEAEIAANSEESAGESLREAQVGVTDLVVHLLDMCFQDISLVTLEVRRESGPGFVKARAQTAKVLGVYLNLCRVHFGRDKQLLHRMDPSDHCGLRREFIRIKHRVLDRCQEARRLLEGTGDNEESKVAVIAAGEKLKECVDTLEQEIMGFGK